MKTFNQLVEERKNTVEYKTEEAKLDFILNINRAIKERNISRSQLAEQLNTSKAYVTKILQGDNVNFTIETMVKICNALGGKLETKILLNDSKIAIDRETRYQDSIDVWKNSTYDNKLNLSPINMVVKVVIQPKQKWF